MNAIDVSGTEGKWEYKYCRVSVGKTALSGKCQLCGASMRYTHALFYPTELGYIKGLMYNHIFVGVDCAEKLLPADECDIPRLAENETKRKVGWRIHYENFGECKTTVDNLVEKGKL
jgi:hypothetical protein